MRFDDLDVRARCRGESDQLIALLVIDVRVRLEQEEVDLPVTECLAGRVETRHAETVGADGRAVHPADGNALTVSSVLWCTGLPRNVAA